MHPTRIPVLLSLAAVALNLAALGDDGPASRPFPGALIPTGLHLAKTADQVEPDFRVAPCLELPAWAATYEKSGNDPTETASLVQFEDQLRKARAAGTTRWASEKWMKSPADYRKLSTAHLADDLTTGDHVVFYNELLIYNNPAFGLVSLRVFHDGFAEFLARKDLADGILHAFDTASATIGDPKADLKHRVAAASTIEGLCILCRLSPAREQIKRREKDFLKNHIAVLKAFATQLTADLKEKNDESTRGYFREPCSVATMSLVYLKEVDLARYDAAVPTVRRIRFPQAQRSADLKAYLAFILKVLESP